MQVLLLNFFTAPLKLQPYGAMQMFIIIIIIIYRIVLILEYSNTELRFIII